MVRYRSSNDSGEWQSAGTQAHPAVWSEPQSLTPWLEDIGLAKRGRPDVPRSLLGGGFCRRGARCHGYAAATPPALFPARCRPDLTCSAQHLCDAGIITSAFQILAAGVMSGSPRPFQFQMPKPMLLFWLLLRGNISGEQRSPRRGA